MRPLKKYRIRINKHVHTKKCFFRKKNHIMGVENFNGGAKYEKTTNFNLEQLYSIQNDKSLLNDTKHQNKLIYKLINKLISYIAVKC